MIPRFSNPHLLVDNARHVSRAEIYREPEDEEYPADTTRANTDALASLESILKRSLGDVKLDITSLEEPKKKWKKTKHAESDETRKPDEAVSFRLLSSSKEPKMMSLLPPPRPTIKVRERPIEDTEEEAELRSQRAAAVAINADLVLNESQKPSLAEPHTTKQAEIIYVKGSLTESPIFILERPALTKPPLVTQHLPPREKPPPHLIDTDKLQHPVFTLPPPSPLPSTPVSSRPRSSAFKRRLRKLRHISQSQPQSHFDDASLKQKPHPTFWRPMREWGGKGMGYAYGYENSKAVWTEGGRWRPYKRDTMTKGTFLV